MSFLNPLLLPGNQGVSSVRILVVEDYEPFRRFVCSTLARRPELQVVGQASDGFEAVQKAGELRPDLIVIDIGLPTLNGIEAARRIRKLSPESKILVLTQESSADVVEEVLRLGVLGYVVKAHAGRELLAAVKVVCQGRRFVSTGVEDCDRIRPADEVPEHLYDKKTLASLAPRAEEASRSHEVQFYPDDDAFVVGFTSYIEAVLKAGNAVIVAATESHTKRVLQRLQEHGVDIAAAAEQGRYLSLDLAETLSSFMVNDLPDPERFLRVVGDLIATATRATGGKHSRVSVCGECASILWAQGNADGAIKVEQFCNQLTKQYEVDILCGFSLSSFYREEDKQVFQRICSGY
jgi:DNA-binding NarL/FixJ family response regulator